MYSFTKPIRTSSFNVERDGAIVDRINRQVGHPLAVREVEIGKIKHYCYANARVSGTDGLTVNCYPENNTGLDISFTGMPDRIPQFYSLLATIERKTN